MTVLRLVRRLTWPLRFFCSGYWMRLWLASTEHQAKLIDRVVELTAEADHNARSVLRLQAELDELRMELKASQALAKDGYRQFREAQAKLDALGRTGAQETAAPTEGPGLTVLEPGAPSGNAGGPPNGTGEPSAGADARVNHRPAPDQIEPGTPCGDAGGPDIQVPKARLGLISGGQP